MYQVEVFQSYWRLEGVTLDEVERVVGLGDDVDTDYLVEPGLVISHRSSAGTTKQVEESHVGRMVRAFPFSQVISPSSFKTSRWCHTVVVDLPTVLAISLTVVGWVLMTVLRTVIRDTERMLAGLRPCSRAGVRSRHRTLGVQMGPLPTWLPSECHKSHISLAVVLRNTESAAFCTIAIFP